jgi:hypothetical protein
MRKDKQKQKRQRRTLEATDMGLYSGQFMNGLLTETDVIVEGAVWHLTNVLSSR